MSRKEKEKFSYTSRSKEDVKKAASQKGGMYDQLFIPEVQVLSVSEGDHNLRLMPPTWKKPKDFSIEAFIHYGVGPDNQKYWCPRLMQEGKPCAVCEERERAQKALERIEKPSKEDIEYVSSMRAAKRHLAWAIDRDEEDAGPQMWNMSWTMNRDLNKLSMDKQSNDVLQIDHPTEGYDISFTVTGQGKKTKYSALEIARRSSPLSETAKQQARWLDFIMDHPVPETLVMFEPDYIEKVFSASAKDEDDEDEGKSKGKRKRSRDDEEDSDDDEPKSKRRRARDEDSDDDDDDKQPRGRRPLKDDDEDSDDDEPKSKRKRSRDDDDEDSDDDEPKSKRKRSRDDDDEDSDDDELKSKRRGSKEEDSDDDSSDDDDEESSDDDEEESPKGKGARNARGGSTKKGSAKQKDASPSDDKEDSDDDEDDEDDVKSKRQSVKDKIRKARAGKKD